MYKFILAEAEGYRTFKDKVSIPLDNQGVIWLTALNLDSKGGSNGGGKTTLVNLIRCVLYILLTDSMMHGKNNCLLRLLFEKDGKSYDIYQFRKLDKEKLAKLPGQPATKSTGYKIIIEGKDKTKHSISENRKFLKRIFTLTEQEFFCSVLATPKKVHTLISGSGPERRQYFENAFSILRSFKLLHEKLGDKYDSLDEKVNELEQVKAQMKVLKEQVAEYKDIKTLKSLLEGLNIKSKELEINLEKVQAEISDIEKKVYNRKKRKEIEAQLEALKPVSKEKLKEITSELESLNKEQEKVQQEKTETEMKVREKKSFLSHLKELDCPKCPTCEQSIDQNSIKKNIIKYKEEILNLSETLPTLIKKLDKFNQRKKELNELVRVSDKRRAIESMLAKYPKEKLPEKSYYEKLKVKAKDLEVDVRLSIKEKTEYTYQLGQLQKLDGQINRYKDRLVNYPKMVEKLKLYDLLWNAYGPKGLKLHQINNLAEKLIQRLPSYTGIMFQERGLKFSRNTSKNNFDILLHRKHSKKPIDIREFSNGEEKRLIPALILAQRDLLPQNKRTNLFLADELDSNLDPIANEAFTNNLLPVLRKKFETVVVISHSKNAKPIGCKHWEIVKEKGVSTLKMLK